MSQEMPGRSLRGTLPMALPAIPGDAIVTFLQAIALSPIPARFNVVTTQPPQSCLRRD